MSTTRRDFLKQAGAAAATLASVGALSRPARGASPLRRPNILILVNDEERHWSTVEPLVDPALLGMGSNAAAGTFRGEIPARMRLRLNGVRFSNYFTSTAPCSPARGVFYTGHHAPETQVVDNMDFGAQASLHPDVPTLADVLTSARYYCAYKGKVHLAKDADLQTADDMLTRYGFHDWQGPNRLGDSEGPLSGAIFDLNIARYAVDWLGGTALEKNTAGQSWLLAVNFINPHDIMLVDIDGGGGVQLAQGETGSGFPLARVPDRDPYYFWWNPQKPANFSGQNGYSVDNSGPRPHILDEFASLLSAGFGNLPLDDTARAVVTVYRDNAHPDRGTQPLVAPMWQAYLNYYLNCIVDNDRAMQTVLDALTANALQDTTIVIYTADHGELAMSHMGASRYTEAASTGSYQTDPVQTQPVVMPLRQKGPFVYQENVSLPFVVTNLSGRSDALVSTYVPAINVDLPILASSVDVLVTCMRWAGVHEFWYRRRFGRTVYHMGMLPDLPGVSLHLPIQNSSVYTTPQWTAGRHGRSCVLFTSDAVNSLDADFAYLAVWNQCAGQSPDVTKRGQLRGVYDGRYKFVRYFSPLDYELNSAIAPTGGYDTLTSAGMNGQDLQLFDRSADPHETQNIAAQSDTLVAQLNQTLLDAMQREIRSPTRTPTTVQNIIDGITNPCG